MSFICDTMFMFNDCYRQVEGCRLRFSVQERHVTFGAPLKTEVFTFLSILDEGNPHHYQVYTVSVYAV